MWYYVYYILIGLDTGSLLIQSVLPIRPLPVWRENEFLNTTTS